MREPAPSLRLPAIKRLAGEIVATQSSKNATVADSVQYLVGIGPKLAAWEDAEDLGLAAYDATKPDALAKGAVHHIEVVRAEMARQLWSRQVFVSVSVLDELLFQAAASGAVDPVLATLGRLRDGEANRAGLLVFPLNSFGILAAGLLRPFRGASVNLINPRYRFAVTPQTNELGRTIRFLNETGPAIGVRKPADEEFIRHIRRSRGARWLERNPLMLAAVNSVSGYYYENEFLLLGRLRALTAALVMLAAMQPAPRDRRGLVFSSSRVNNWETRDVHHYLVLQSGWGSKLSGQAVPIHERRRVGELSDLAIDIDPRFWARRSAEAGRIYESVETLYGGYMKYSVGLRKQNSLGRTYRKLFEAVAYFRRSFQESETGYSATLSLATAFEMMLTDSYAPGTAALLKKRVRTLLRGVSGTRAYQMSVEQLYYRRNEVIHTGLDDEAELEQARRAFVLAFTRLVPRLTLLQGHEEAPIAALLTP